MHTCWNSWYCINMPTRLFSVQNHARYILQNHPTGKVCKVMERHKCRISPGCSNSGDLSTML